LTGLSPDDFQQAGLGTENVEIFKRDLINFLLSRYELFRKQHDTEMIQQAEKWLVLETIDQAWKQHMVNLDHLKEGIGLRGWGQKTPLIEYKREAFDMFREMMNQISWDIVSHIFHMNLERFDERAFEARRKRELDEINLVSGESEEGPQKPVQREGEKVGRNDPCPCGSGKKYKKCHG
jgi:preprotein translocase subunit SecA